MSSTSTIIFPHHLFEENPAITQGNRVFLVEEWLFFRQYPFHKRKISFHRASMKAYHARLKSLGFQVTYVDSTQDTSDIRKLLPALKKMGFKTIRTIEVSDNWLEKRLRETADQYGIQLNFYPSPLFLNKLEDIKAFFNGKKQLRQTDFYIQQRKTRKVMIEKGETPVGGKWTYDADNRKKYPRNKTIPEIRFSTSDPFYEEAIAYTQEHFNENPGEIDTEYLYPISFDGCKLWFDQFLKDRFADFGTYQDAMVEHASFLNHSVISPMLNVGLLNPAYIIGKALEFGQYNNIPLNSLEGFIRQVLGWREFLRGVYEFRGGFQRTRNYWGFTRKIPASFWDGTTGILPIDQVIKKVLKTGYAHHIERLMILGNFMLLCEFDPDEVYEWFMTLFIDAYDWVMVPNVYGMSQFSDGGLMATKPYISGSNYLLKMSDYKKGDWDETWTALFWRFMDVYRDKLGKNPRLNMLIRSYDKMDVGKKQIYLQLAESFLAKLD